MKISDHIKTLVAAQGDPLRWATVEVDFAHGNWPDAQREALREALVLASITHWFDRDVLSALADPGSPAPSLQPELEALNCTERFAGRGPTAYNVKQTTRSAIRKALAEAQPARVLALSARAAAHFASDASLSGQVEYLYHLLVADAERGALECSALCDRWAIDRPPEYQHALVLALEELLDAGLLLGRARGAAKLLVVTEQVERREKADLRAGAAEVRSLLAGSPDPLDAVRATDLEGQVALGLGERAQAKQCFGDSLARLESLVTEAPDDIRRLYLFAVAVTRLGDLEEKTAPASALEHFSRAVDALDRIAATDPANQALQRERAVARARRGDVLVALPGRLSEAGADQRQALEILKALVEDDPSNTIRQRDLALQLSRVGDIEAAEARLPQALECHEAAVHIARELIAIDPARLRWQADLAALLSSVADDMQKLERFDAAELVLEEAVGVYRMLTQLESGWVEWQESLRATLFTLGSLAQQRQRFDVALAHFEANCEAALAAFQSRPDDREVQRECAIAYNKMGQIRAALGQPAAATADYSEAVRIMEAVAAARPDDPVWQQDLVNLRSWLTVA